MASSVVRQATTKYIKCTSSVSLPRTGCLAVVLNRKVLRVSMAGDGCSKFEAKNGYGRTIVTFSEMCAFVHVKTAFDTQHTKQQSLTKHNIPSK